MTKRRSRRSAPLGRGPTEERNSKTLGSQDSRSEWEPSLVDRPVDEILAALTTVCCEPRERPEISDETIDIRDTRVFCGDWAQLRNCHNQPVCWPCEQAA